jgi:beta-lactamase regulating signal transducer with metallopeptidase domain
MILPYTLRLICLCFASFFVVHTVMAAAIWAAAPRAMRTGESMRPRSGARFLLGLRLLPVTFAAVVVAGLCVPSYLWLETNESTERVGLACCALALLGVLLCADSLIRSVRGIFISWRGVMRSKSAGFEKRAAESLPITTVNSDAPVLALAGLLRPRVIVSRSILQSLSAKELDAAIEHERAHQRSHDNWKRLALAFAPEILPFTQVFAPLNRCWAKLIEWAADDDATQGNFGRSLSLAGALVRVARIGGAFSASPLISFFLGRERELSARIERLIAPVPARIGLPRQLRMGLKIGIAAFGVLAIAAILHPSVLVSVHEALEQLLR